MAKRKVKVAPINVTPRRVFAPPFTPQPVSDLDMAFGGIDGIMPAMSDIPEDYPDSHKWQRMFSDFFYLGASNLVFSPKDGIDAGLAWRHVRTIMGSWESKHQHKEAACAYLLSLWFNDIKYTKGKLELYGRSI